MSKSNNNTCPDLGKSINKNVKSWKEICGTGKLIKSFSTIITDEKGNPKLYIFQPHTEEIYIPYYEDMEGYLIGYIIGYNTKDNKELFRKNILNIDMVEWID